MAGRAHTGLSWLGAGAPANGKWRGLPGRRRRRAGEGFHGGRNRHGISRCAWRCASSLAEWQEPGAWRAAPRAWDALADPPRVTSFPAERLFTAGGLVGCFDPPIARGDQPRRIRAITVECRSKAAAAGAPGAARPVDGKSRAQYSGLSDKFDSEQQPAEQSVSRWLNFTTQMHSLCNSIFG